MSWKWPNKDSAIRIDLHAVHVIKNEGGDVDAAQIAEIRRLGEVLRSKIAELAAALKSAG